MRFLVRFLRFWYDFIVGDAWEIAAGVVAVLGIGAGLLHTDGVERAFIPLVVALGVGLVLAGSLLAEVRRRRRDPAHAAGR